MPSAVRRGPLPLGGLCMTLACYWALTGSLAAWDGFANYSSGNDPGFAGFSVTALVTNLSMAFAPALLAVLGPIHLSAGGWAGSRLITAWTAVMAACVTVNILAMLWGEQLWPVLWVPSRMDLLALSAGYFMAGAAMTVTLAVTLRRRAMAHDSDHPPPLAPGLVIVALGAVAYALTGHSLYVLVMSWWPGLCHAAIAITARHRNRTRAPAGSS